MNLNFQISNNIIANLFLHYDHYSQCLYTKNIEYLNSIQNNKYGILFGNEMYIITDDHVKISEYFTRLVSKKRVDNENNDVNDNNDDCTKGIIRQNDQDKTVLSNLNINTPYIIKLKSSTNEQAFDLIMKLIYGFKIVCIPRQYLLDTYFIFKELNVHVETCKFYNQNIEKEFLEKVLCKANDYTEEEYRRMLVFGISHKRFDIIKWCNDNYGINNLSLTKLLENLTTLDNTYYLLEQNNILKGMTIQANNSITTQHDNNTNHSWHSKLDNLEDHFLPLDKVYMVYKHICEKYLNDNEPARRKLLYEIIIKHKDHIENRYQEFIVYLADYVYSHMDEKCLEKEKEQRDSIRAKEEKELGIVMKEDEEGIKVKEVEIKEETIGIQEDRDITLKAAEELEEREGEEGASVIKVKEEKGKMTNNGKIRMKKEIEIEIDEEEEEELTKRERNTLGVDIERDNTNLWKNKLIDSELKFLKEMNNKLQLDVNKLMEINWQLKDENQKLISKIYELEKSNPQEEAKHNQPYHHQYQQSRSTNPSSGGHTSSGTSIGIGNVNSSGISSTTSSGINCNNSNANSSGGGGTSNDNSSSHDLSNSDNVDHDTILTKSSSSNMNGIFIKRYTRSTTPNHVLQDRPQSNFIAKIKTQFSMDIKDEDDTTATPATILSKKTNSEENICNPRYTSPNHMKSFMNVFAKPPMLVHMNSGSNDGSGNMDNTTNASASGSNRTPNSASNNTMRTNLSSPKSGLGIIYEKVIKDENRGRPSNYPFYLQSLEKRASSTKRIIEMSADVEYGNQKPYQNQANIATAATGANFIMQNISNNPFEKTPRNRPLSSSPGPVKDLIANKLNAKIQDINQQQLQQPFKKSISTKSDELSLENLQKEVCLMNAGLVHLKKIIYLLEFKNDNFLNTNEIINKFINEIKTKAFDEICLGIYNNEKIDLFVLLVIIDIPNKKVIVISPNPNTSQNMRLLQCVKDFLRERFSMIPFRHEMHTRFEPTYPLVRLNALRYLITLWQCKGVTSNLKK